MDRTRDVLANWPLPPEGGWTAEDLDLLPQDGPNGELDLFKRVELIDGALILMMSPQRLFHDRVVRRLATRLEAQAPDSLSIAAQMTIKIAARQRPDPDLVIFDAAADDIDRTYFLPGETQLVVEVVSPESEHRDWHRKPAIYAGAGIPHFWIIAEENGKPVVHTYELDEATSAYAPTGIFRGKLAVEVPFPIAVDLADLLG